MKKIYSVIIACLLVASLILGGCSSSSSGTSESEGGAKSGGPTKLTLWTFVPLHLELYKDAEKRWNKEHPDKQIKLETSNYPYDDMHNKLLVSLQSGVGAPDISDIEFSQFPNFLKGEPQLVDLSDIVNKVKNDYVQARLDIYSKDGKYYGIPTHVGATVMYYNKEIMDKAGVNIDNIKTWDDYIAAGKQVVAKTKKPMTTIETGGPWTFWPLISQQNSDFFDKNGKVTLDNETNVKTLQFMYDLIYKEKIAKLTPGGVHNGEEYYGFMNQGGAASVLMPFWYMSRFVSYMPDLKGKIAVRPLPEFTPGGNRSAGMGGTGTVVTKQSKHIELAKEFLAFAKTTKEANIQIWKLLGFDPARTDVWDSPELREPNKFTEYFGNDIFDTVKPLLKEIAPIHLTEQSPQARSVLQTGTLDAVLRNKTMKPAEALKDAADKLPK
ncbi:ABC transporter substrate-binding protein [Neobacillus cucumis]|uniref:Arabinose-binding protein n=1 Tax=Neobacillus cucumis TaxID=1740721 RepID=A0A2N5HVZ6_9BACI|nr:sugar ABC transporter substrate-binding protein [Neobacillus cucumis]PLS09692.1 arabinose-binding protein [Neobacillus cucumis]